MANEARRYSLPYLEVTALSDFVLMHEIDGARLDQVRSMVGEGLGLSGKGSLDVHPNTSRLMLDNISKGLYLSCMYVDIELPDAIGFVTGERGVPDATIENGCYITAEVILEKKGYPNGLINFSRFFLEHEVAGRIEGRRGRIDLIGGLHLMADASSHEPRHIRQSIDSIDNYTRDVRILHRRGIRAWMKTPTEREAVAFANQFADTYLESLMEKF
jgi:hypothetical protein